MADWTTVAAAGVAGAAALGGGVLGYLGARVQARVGLRQVEADLERLREQHREEHMRNRQGTYHRFLNTAGRLRAIPPEWAAVNDDERERASKAVEEFSSLLNGVELFGTREVRLAAEKLHGSLILGEESWWKSRGRAHAGAAVAGGDSRSDLEAPDRGRVRRQAGRPGGRYAA